MWSDGQRKYGQTVNQQSSLHFIVKEKTVFSQRKAMPQFTREEKNAFQSNRLPRGAKIAICLLEFFFSLSGISQGGEGFGQFCGQLSVKKCIQLISRFVVKKTLPLILGLMRKDKEKEFFVIRPNKNTDAKKCVNQLIPRQRVYWCASRDLRE